jgi:hypothetical protein
MRLFVLEWPSEKNLMGPRLNDPILLIASLRITF